MAISILQPYSTKEPRELIARNPLISPNSPLLQPQRRPTQRHLAVSILSVAVLCSIPPYCHLLYILLTILYIISSRFFQLFFLLRRPQPPLLRPFIRHLVLRQWRLCHSPRLLPVRQARRQHWPRLSRRL